MFFCVAAAKMSHSCHGGFSKCDTFRIRGDAGDPARSIERWFVLAARRLLGAAPCS